MPHAVVVGGTETELVVLVPAMVEEKVDDADDDVDEGDEGSGAHSGDG